MCFPLLYFASTFLFYYYDYFSHFALDEIDHLRIKGNESSNPSCRFNYKKDHHAAVQGASLPVLFFLITKRVLASSPCQEEISPNILTRSRSTLLLNRVQKEYV